ncbi:MAG: hypothetical protein OEV80_01250, partial [candidate division Zixibacteria bacterium]|nr:hypothetical protein [candidate division Zixibacteria bacterium]
SPTADPSTGYRRVVAMGNVFQNLTWELNSLPAGTYFWSVQAIDNNFEGSQFAVEQQFVVDYVCGDINNDGAGPDISDLVYLVDYMFTAGPPPPMMEAADVDGSGGIDIADLVYVVDYMFNGGPAPVCG